MLQETMTTLEQEENKAKQEYHKRLKLEQVHSHTVHVQYTCIYCTCTVLVCSTECKCVVHVMPVCVLSVYMWVCSIIRSWSKRSISYSRIAELQEQLARALQKIEDRENHLTRTEHELTNITTRSTVHVCVHVCLQRTCVH